MGQLAVQSLLIILLQLSQYLVLCTASFLLILSIHCSQCWMTLLILLPRLTNLATDFFAICLSLHYLFELEQLNWFSPSEISEVRALWVTFFFSSVLLSECTLNSVLNNLHFFLGCGRQFSLECQSRQYSLNDLISVYLNKLLYNTLPDDWCFGNFLVCPTLLQLLTVMGLSQQLLRSYGISYCLSLDRVTLLMVLKGI